MKRLGLNNVYSVRRGLRTVNLYQDSPIAVTFNQNATHAVSFVVNLVSDSQFEITHCKLDGKEIEGRFKGNTAGLLHGPCISLAAK